MKAMTDTKPETRGALNSLLRFCLEKKVIILILVLTACGWGWINAPFDLPFSESLPRDPVPVDAIPDIGENQQIVFTEWMGRSPQEVEDQVTYPLTVALLGVPGIKTIRSYSMMSFSTIYVIFKEDVEFYGSRSRVLEKLNSLPSETLPDGVRPTLGPDATALGQIFWYTLEGHDAQGNPTGGWDLDELRSIQDWHVRYSLLSADGVSEVASIGGFVKEYQVDVDPDALLAQKVKLEEVINAVRTSNVDVSARTIEMNSTEYVIRGIGFIKTLEDLENAVIKVRDNVPVYVKNVAHVTLGPALRRGALDKGGAEAVGGVVVVRYGENPLAAIKHVKQKIEEIAPGLPRKTLPDGTESQVTIVPFYDRTGLIFETLGTLEDALTLEILVTIIVVIVMVMHLKSALLISGMLPLSVLICFIAMKATGVDANVVALSGIAIAIGTIVDMGIVICENILNHLDQADRSERRIEAVFRASSEVGSAVLTAVSTTVVSFLPVFFMEGAEGKLFKPLAFTKTYALVASVVVALTVIPPLAHLFFRARADLRRTKRILPVCLVVFGLSASFFTYWWAGAIIALLGLYKLIVPAIPSRGRAAITLVSNMVIAAAVTFFLARVWSPLGPEAGQVKNFIFAAGLIGGVLFFFRLFFSFYGPLLSWCLNHKLLFLMLPLILVVFGAMTWLGFDAVLGWLPHQVKALKPMQATARAFPGLGKEFMPALDEGSFLYMPTTMPHASIGEVLDVLQKQDMALQQIPEIESAVGKLGRVRSPLDPAPISMIETVISYLPEYLLDEAGRRLTFRHDPDGIDYFRTEKGETVPAPDGQPYLVNGKFERDKEGRLIPDRSGKAFRLWRPALDPSLNPGRDAWQGIKTPKEIWDSILMAAEIPGTTSAPMLQPISTRIVMLQSGMRAPMGLKVKGPDLETIEAVGLQIENLLKEVPSIEPATVFADRIVGKPYLEIQIDRQAIARYGIHMQNVQNVIETAIGGMQITTTVEGRERYPVRVRYMRELRDSIESLDRILVPAPNGTQIPLMQLADIRYLRGPQVIKSEDTFLTGYVLFDKKPGFAEVDVVEEAKAFLQGKLDSNELKLPAGVSYAFAGSYENQVRAQKKLTVILPLALLIIFIILYLQFSSVSTTALVFIGIVVAWSGGFLMIWLYGQPWFLDFSVLGASMRELFQVHSINLSVAIWVGFLALFGIASDDGVIMATYLKQTYAQKNPGTIREIREATIEAGKRRVRPCLMTTATTVLALIPVLTSTGRGSDIMVPMAIPSFGGMVVEVMTMLVVPVLYCLIREVRVKRGGLYNR
ncbi:MAG: efflux RND transporter permease subunit [Planctomycetota bacterium]